MVETSILPAEVEQFARLASDWWDPNGASAMLHKLNPVRLAYIRDRIDQHWGLDEHELKPLRGRRAADVGCGANCSTQRRSTESRRPSSFPTEVIERPLDTTSSAH